MDNRIALMVIAHDEATYYAHVERVLLCARAMVAKAAKQGNILLHLALNHTGHATLREQEYASLYLDMVRTGEIEFVYFQGECFSYYIEELLETLSPEMIVNEATENSRLDFGIKLHLYTKYRALT